MGSSLSPLEITFFPLGFPWWHLTFFSFLSKNFGTENESVFSKRIYQCLVTWWLQDESDLLG